MQFIKCSYQQAQRHKHIHALNTYTPFIKQSIIFIGKLSLHVWMCVNSSLNSLVLCENTVDWIQDMDE